MQQYEVILKNQKKGFYNRLTINAIIFTTVLLICYCFTPPAGRPQITIAIAALTLLIVFFLLYRYLQKNDAKLKMSYILIFSLIMVTWLLLHQYIPAFVQVLFAVFSVASIRRFIVLVHSDKIIYPSFPGKYILWKDLNSVILKDGLLTIDFKNNKLIQQLIDESSSSINEKDFNDFCKSKLTIEDLRMTNDD